MGFIRLLLAIAVFDSHFTTLDFPVVNGHEAVLAFFAISGFYMALILDKTYGSAREFYLSRFITLYPMYVFAVIISTGLLVTWDIHPMTTLDDVRQILADPATFVVMAWTSATVIGQELLFCLDPTPGGGLAFIDGGRGGLWTNAPLIQTWSLSLEITFYALAPFLVRLRTKHLVWLTGSSLLARTAIVAGPQADSIFFMRFFPTEFWLFGGGILAYRAYRRLSAQTHPLDFVALALLVVALLMGEMVPDHVKPFAIPMATLLALPFVFRGFRRFAFDRLVGKISYPFYLLHFSVIALFETMSEDPTGWDMLFTTLAASVLTYCLFEPGIEVFKVRLRTRLIVPAEPTPDLLPAPVSTPTDA